MKHLSLRDHARLCFAMLLAFAALGTVQAAENSAPAASNTARMTDLQVRMMPFGAIFDTLASENPSWPLQDKPDAVTPTQLSCLREQLSTPGYRRYKLAQVRLMSPPIPRGWMRRSHCWNRARPISSASW